MAAVPFALNEGAGGDEDQHEDQKAHWRVSYRDVSRIVEYCRSTTFYFILLELDEVIGVLWGH
jgi:hypothetical protein